MKGSPAIQVFGRKDSRETQRALRFFKERRLEVAFVDLASRPIAPTELRRFTDRLGAETVLDRDGRAFRDRGLGYMRMDDGEIRDLLLREPALLRLPLVRLGGDVAAGVDELGWRRLAAAAIAAAEGPPRP